MFKALLQGGFSLMIFGWSQIVMDIQPLLVMLTGEGHLHGFSHTYIGASLLAIFSIATGKHLAEFGLKVMKISDAGKPIVISWRITSASAFIGTYSHVLLDSLMHRDMQPYYPYSLINNMLDIISVDTLNKACLYSGIIGAGLFYALQLIHKTRLRLKNVSTNPD